MKLQYKLTEKAKELSMIDFTPRRATKGSAGYDIKACIEEPLTILSTESIKIPTGIHLWIGSSDVPPMFGTKHAGLLMPRSSIKGLLLTNSIGLIDDDYQGEYLVSVYNYTDSPITIQPGQSITQLVFFIALLADFVPVEEFQEVTNRGEGGFGSTGE